MRGLLSLRIAASLTLLRIIGTQRLLSESADFSGCMLRIADRIAIVCQNLRRKYFCLCAATLEMNKMAGD